jgi:hypothetical protein
MADLVSHVKVDMVRIKHPSIRDEEKPNKLWLIPLDWRSS